ncbi:MAG: hypothetical protein F6K30_11775 [Cyanothece sp. SIO2G6]|nr:hypothetical protein [Cyanothece sp. SIO2G6]
MEKGIQIPQLKHPIWRSDRATNDPDPQLREWAKKKLEEMKKNEENNINT